MPQYLVAGYLPDDFDPSQMDEAVGRDIHALNKEMIAAGVRKFACGLGASKSLRTQTDGEVADCLNPQAARSIVPIYQLRARMAMAGRSKAEMLAAVKTAYEKKQLPSKPLLVHVRGPIRSEGAATHHGVSGRLPDLVRRNACRHASALSHRIRVGAAAHGPHRQGASNLNGKPPKSKINLLFRSGTVI
ncbi:hypothetical protein [Luteibacter sp.]|jgi:hypothetical protein|uniref:hypothetical protein n=1 Tax=Luteibacter sp. TaxID=1886636 RepID=UPI002F4221C6